MSYFDHIRHCNNADLSRSRAIVVEHFSEGRTDTAIPVGRISEARAQDLLARFDCFEESADGTALRFAQALDSVEKRTDALARVAKSLADAGETPGLRGELYAGRTDWLGETYFLYDRAVSAWFGFRAYGVHMNGFVRKPDGIHLWIGTRAFDKSTYPGMLDNTVAGGQPHNLSLMDNLIKECAEEADIPEPLARQAHAVGCLTYIHDDGTGIKPDCMFGYDLELPADFTPRNTDGELDRFDLLPASEVMEIVRDSARFKFNCNLVLIDFFIRHGLLTPDDTPDYNALCAGLRRSVL